MVSIDLFRKFPTIRTRANALEPVVRNTITLDKANTKRATTLDRVPGSRPRRKADVGPDNPARFLQILVESIAGKPLSSFFPVAEGVPKIIGVDGLTKPAGFDSFLEGFYAAMEFFKLPGQPTVRDDGTHRRLRAGALGVRDAANVGKATPRPIRKFDEFAAMVPPSPATLQAALEAGTSDGLPLGFGEALSAFIGATRAAVFANDTGALLNLGQDFAAVLVALHQVVNGGETSERGSGSAMRKIGKNHWVAPGFERRTKGRANVVGVDIDGEVVATRDVKITDGKFVRRRKRKA